MINRIQSDCIYSRNSILILFCRCLIGYFYWIIASQFQTSFNLFVLIHFLLFLSLLQYIYLAPPSYIIAARTLIYGALENKTFVCSIVWGYPLTTSGLGWFGFYFYTWSTRFFKTMEDAKGGGSGRSALPYPYLKFSLRILDQSKDDFIEFIFS